MLCGGVTVLWVDHFNWLDAHVRCHSHCAYLIYSRLTTSGVADTFLGRFSYFVGNFNSNSKFLNSNSKYSNSKYSNSKFLNSNSFFLNNQFQFRLELSDPHSNTIQVYNNQQFIVHPQSDQECFSCGC